MSKLFGTDGIRGVAGGDLTAETAYKLGAAIAVYLYQKIDSDEADCRSGSNAARPQVLIGRDTRQSGSMLSCALASGLSAYGADATDGGVLPTPAIAFLAQRHFAAGVVISASHNSAEYNGLKVFSSDGHKIPDSDEELLESIMGALPAPQSGTEIGIVSNADLSNEYTAHIKKIIKGKRHALIDLSNGAATAVARRIFEGSDFLSDTPDGRNINRNCGSTDMKELSRRTSEGGYDVGIAFDGDADRCLAADETGAIIDGDKIVAALALDMKNRGKLKNNAVAVTGMTNLGFHLFCRDNGIAVEITDVGDKYVFARMQEKDIILGGEQSGHIILREYANTGDGLLTAAMILNLLAANKGKKASEIFGVMKTLPQVLLNVKVDGAKKEQVCSYGPLVALRGTYERVLCDRGRILIRPSGTEALVRVMIEGEDGAQISEMAYSLANLIVEAAK